MPGVYASDLTESQWLYILEHVFSWQPPRDARHIINGLLYQLRARCRWDQLPPSFDGLSLKNQLQEWTRSETWQAILGSFNVVSGSPFKRALRALKRALGYFLRRIPGGPILIPPARKVLRFARSTWRFSRRQIHRLRRLPTASAVTVDPGIAVCKALTEGRKEEALQLLDSWIAAGVGHPGPYFTRASLVEERGRFHDACQDLWCVLALESSGVPEHRHAHAALGRCFARLNQIERAVSHVATHLWIDRFGDLSDELQNSESLLADSRTFELVIEAHNDLAEFVINYHADFGAAIDFYRRKDQLQESYRSQFPFHSKRTLYLGPDWVRNIGHIALLDFFVKMVQLGWRDWDELLLLAPGLKTANAAYLDCYRPYFKLVTDAHLAGRLLPFSEAIGQRVAHRLELPDGRETYFLNGMGAIQEEWEKLDRPPLLALSEADREFGRRQLREMTIPDEAWFVCLHVRAPGYHKEWGNDQQAHRNADILTYLGAVHEVVRRGGWVIRLGDSTMPPLPPTQGLIDYALSRYKSARMDVFLCASCRFFVGTASGIAHVPATFGVPAVLTNWISNAFPVYGRRDLFLPKLVWSEKARRMLTFAEALAPEMRRWSYSGVALREHGLRGLDNTPKELSEVVAEMLDRLDGQYADRDEDLSRWKTFEALARANGLIGFSRIGRDYLRRHADLLQFDQAALGSPFVRAVGVAA
jgi:putative glycosyltransferase (TIGR04372 family)